MQCLWKKKVQRVVIELYKQRWYIYRLRSYFFRKVNLNVSIPVIEAGGLGKNSHIFECLIKLIYQRLLQEANVYETYLNQCTINYPDKKLLKTKNK